MNIVAMVGTNPYSFERMIRPLDELAAKHGWKVFVQLGYTSYIPEHCAYERFVERGMLMGYIESADVILTHGGFGSINDALDFNKPVVAVPRRPDFHESQDRQEEMVREMEREGYLIGVYDTSDLESALQKAVSFQPKVRVPSQIPKIIKDFLRDQGLL